jgi:hypothetical protein
VLKYAIGGTLAAFVLIIGGFLILARYNDRNAEAGPASEFRIIVDGDVVSPRQLEMPPRQLAQLTLANRGPASVVLGLKSQNVEQLPAETRLAPGSAARGIPVPNFRLEASAGTIASSFVRFTSSGRYELTLTSPGRVPQTVVVIVP